MTKPHNIIDTMRALLSDGSLLIRQEIRLARAEAEEKLGQAQNGLIALAASMIIALVALLVLAQALVAALANIMPPPLAALLVGITLAIIAFVAMHKAQEDLKPKNLAPRRTAKSVAESTNTLKEAM
jgi:hypothetical protein